MGPPRGELSRETERADKGVAHSPLLRSHTHATQRGQRMINLENRSHMRHGVCARFSTLLPSQSQTVPPLSPTPCQEGGEQRKSEAKNINKTTLSHSRQARHRCELARACTIPDGDATTLAQGSTTLS